MWGRDEERIGAVDAQALLRAGLGAAASALRGHAEDEQSRRLLAPALAAGDAA